MENEVDIDGNVYTTRIAMDDMLGEEVEFIVYMDADDNIAEKLGKFYETLYAINPKAVGGKLPDGNIYLGK